MRHISSFPTLPQEMREDVYRRMEQLLSEENEYCDKGNYNHMAQILTRKKQEKEAA